MSEKIIIENRTKSPLIHVLNAISVVIEQGKISGDGDKKQYCYHTTFKSGIEISAFLNKKSDRFVCHGETCWDKK